MKAANKHIVILRSSWVPWLRQFALQFEALCRGIGGAGNFASDPRKS